MHAAGGDTDLAAEAELAAVGELSRSVVRDDGAIDLAQKFVGCGLILGDDAVRVL